MVKPFTTIAIFIFILVAFLHLLRFLLGWKVVIEGAEISMWASVVGGIVAGGLALMLWRESKKE